MSVTTIFRSFRNTNYRIWACGAFVSNIGTWVQRVAQDWIVLTQLTNHNASAVGVVMALQFAPPLLFLPWTGFAADYFNQRKLLLTTQAIMGILALGLGVLTITGLVQLWHVYVFAFLFGTANAFDAPARQTFVAELVGDNDLPNAVALNSTSFNSARMIGPAVSGLVIAAVGTGWAFALNGLSFIAVLISLLFLQADKLYPQVRAARKKGSFVEGLRYVKGRPDLKAILLMLFFIGTFGLNFPIYISTMAVNVFHTDARGFGLLSSVMACGTLLGALMCAGRERPRFTTLILGAGFFGVGCILAAVSPGYWWFAAMLGITGVASLTFMNTSNSLVQLTTESSMRGRVMALRICIAMGGTPIGAPIVGWVADHYGARCAMGIGAAAGIIAAVIGILVWLRQRRASLPATTRDVS